MAELQAFIQQAKDFREEIEEMKVKLEYKSIEILELENATEMMQDRKE